MQINSHYPRARADWFRKSGTPPVRPQSHDLHLDGLRASPDPPHGDLASQYLGPLQTPPRGRRQRTQETKRPRKKLSNQPMPGPFASRHSQRHRSTYQPKALEITPLAKRKASRAQHFSTSCAPARCRTSQLAVGAFASSSAWKAIATLGAHPPPARSNGLRNALGPYHFLSFHRLHNQPQALEPQAVREVFGTSRARVNTDCMQSRGASNLRMFTPRGHRIPLHCNGKQRPFRLRVCKLKC